MRSVWQDSYVPVPLAGWPTYSRSLFHYETDANGVCHFSNYLRIGEEAFLEGLSRLGLLPALGEETLAVSRAVCEYRQPLVFGEEFCVFATYIDVHRASADLGLSIMDKSGSLKAHLRLTLVSILRGSHQVRPLMPALRELLQRVVLSSQVAWRLGHRHKGREE